MKMQPRNEIFIRAFITGKALRMAVSLLLGILAVPGLSMAASHYIRAGATGNGSGTDWTNAYTQIPSSLVRGDTYYVAAGTYAQIIHVFNDSGTAPITIRSATRADHGTSTGWSASYVGQAVFGQFQFDTGNYVIDGVYRSSRDSGYGMRVNIPASCSGECPAFWLMGGHTVNNVTVEYVDMPGEGQNNQTVHSEYGLLAIPGVGGSGGSYSNIVFSHDYIHDEGVGGTPLQTGGIDGFTVEYCDIARNTSTPTFHSEALTDEGSNNMVFRYNWFEDINGTGDLVSLSPGIGPLTTTNWQIYGNIFWQHPGNFIGTGVIACISNNVCSDVYIYNNDFIGFVGTTSHNGISWSMAGSSSTNINAEDNLWYNDTNVTPEGPVTSDYNYYINCTGVPSESHIETGSTDIFNDSANGNFHLLQETKDGIHLSSPYDLDPDGVKRGSDNGIWTRGTYQFGSSPTAPSNLSVSVH